MREGQWERECFYLFGFIGGIVATPNGAEDYLLVLSAGITSGVA